MKEPKSRYGTKKAIDELVAQYGYRHDEWMQDWPIEIADYTQIEKYFQHYDEQSDEDKKFSLMEMLLQALTDVDNDIEFDKYWRLLKPRIVKDFKIHEYTIWDWCCFDEDPSHLFKVTPNLRKVWYELNAK